MRSEVEKLNGTGRCIFYPKIFYLNQCRAFVHPYFAGQSAGNKRDDKIMADRIIFGELGRGRLAGSFFRQKYGGQKNLGAALLERVESK